MGTTECQWNRSWCTDPEAPNYTCHLNTRQCLLGIWSQYLHQRCMRRKDDVSSTSLILSILRGVILTCCTVKYQVSKWVLMAVGCFEHHRILIHSSWVCSQPISVKWERNISKSIRSLDDPEGINLYILCMGAKNPNANEAAIEVMNFNGPYSGLHVFLYMRGHLHAAGLCSWSWRETA